MRFLAGLILLIPLCLFAQEEPQPKEKETPQEQPRREPTPDKPKPQKPAPKATGVADDFPMYEERFLPDYKPKNETVQIKEPEKKEPEVQSNSPPFWDRVKALFQGDRDRTFLNILLICLLVGVFVLYRLRGRR